MYGLKIPFTVMFLMSQESFDWLTLGPIPTPEPITTAKRIQSSTQTTDMMVNEEGGGDYQNERGMDAN